MSILTTYQAIPDLPVVSTLNGTYAIEVVTNPGTPVAQSCQASMSQVASFISFNGSFSGAQIISGSPQGALSASPGQLAFDSVGLGLWIKLSGSNTSGWFEIG